MTRILFVTSNRIGDAVLSTGLLDHVLTAHPGARVTVACGPLPAPLFAAAPGVERVLTMTKAPRGGHWLRLWRDTVTTPWSLVVDLRASALAWLLPTRRRLVYRPSHSSLHRVRQLGALVGRADDPPAPRLWASAGDEAEAALLVPAGRPVLAVGPTANWGGKQWPAERFSEVVAALTGPGGILPGAVVAVVAAPNERAAAEPVLASLPADRRIDLIGKGGLPVIGAALGRCAFYLGNDSGLMHMAAAAGTPTLGLFGPSREDLYAPWGGRAAWVRTPESFEEIIGAPGYDHRSEATHMTGLDVPTVIAAAEGLWRRVGQAC